MHPAIPPAYTTSSAVTFISPVEYTFVILSILLATLLYAYPTIPPAYTSPFVVSTSTFPVE